MEYNLDEELKNVSATIRTKFIEVFEKPDGWKLPFSIKDDPDDNDIAYGGESGFRVWIRKDKFYSFFKLFKKEEKHILVAFRWEIFIYENCKTSSFYNHFLSIVNALQEQGKFEQRKRKIEWTKAAIEDIK